MATEKKNIFEAYCKAWAEMPTLTCDKENEHYHSKYATNGHSLAEVRAVLKEHGLAVQQWVSSNESGAEIHTQMIHVSGEVLSFPPLTVPVERKNAQGFKSASTYGRRIALLAVCGADTKDEDDDGNDAAASPPRNGRQNGRPVDAPTDSGQKVFYLMEKWTGMSGKDFTDAAKRIRRSLGISDEVRPNEEQNQALVDFIERQMELGVSFIDWANEQGGK